MIVIIYVKICHVGRCALCRHLACGHIIVNVVLLQLWLDKPVLFIVNTDLTITTEKVVKIFATLPDDWVDNSGYWLGLPDSKRDVIQRSFQSRTRRRDAYLDLYASDHPYPTWKTIAAALRGVGLPHQADVVESTYVQGTVL